MKLISITLVASAALRSCVAFAPVQTLLTENAAKIEQLKGVAAAYPDAPSDSIFYLRYSLMDKPDDEVSAQLKSNLEWRSKDGKEICSAAAKSVDAATEAGSWDNTPVRDNAPHASIVNKYITQKQCLTTTLNSGDLCYCIRAGKPMGDPICVFFSIPPLKTNTYLNKMATAPCMMIRKN